MGVKKFFLLRNDDRMTIGPRVYTEVLQSYEHLRRLGYITLRTRDVLGSTRSWRKKVELLFSIIRATGQTRMVLQTIKAHSALKNDSYRSTALYFRSKWERTK